MDGKQQNGKIASFTRGVTTRKLPVVIICNTEEKGIAAKNKLMEIAEKDILANQYGQIILGNYYYKCFVTKSVKKGYLDNKRLIKIDLTLQTDRPYWIKETVFSFNGSTVTSQPESYFLDYPLDYPYDYFANTKSYKLNNIGFTSCNFIMRIFGACVNPSIIIGGHTYKVNCTISEGEYLTIDSVDKKIYLTGNDGSISNKFNERSRESYVFEKIQPGENIVSFNGDLMFSVVLLEERSEPKWT